MEITTDPAELTPVAQDYLKAVWSAQEWSDEKVTTKHLADRLGDDFIAGLVLYTGDQTYSFGDKMRAMPVSALWEVG